MTGSADRSHVVITGMMGSGKSTLADAVAGALGRPVRDSDRDLEQRTGRTGAELATEVGVEALHRMEAAVLLEALADDQRCIISAAGSVVEDAACRAALRQRAFVVVLDASADLLQARIRWGDHRRPMSRQEIETLIDRRSPLWDEIADVTIVADQPVQALTTEVLAALDGARPRGA